MEPTKSKITKKRSTKKELYKKERKEILNKINKILGINEDNNIIYLYDIENDENKKEQILALSESVKKYFKAGNWALYRDEESKDNHFLLCKSVYKEMDYSVTSRNSAIKRNNVRIQTPKYTISKINNDV